MNFMRLVIILLLGVGWCGLGATQETNTPAVGSAPTNDTPFLCSTVNEQDPRTFQTRVFPIFPGMMETILSCQHAQTTNEQEAINAFFIDAGVPLPEGAAIFYSPSDNALVAHGPENMLSRMQSIIHIGPCVPWQVEIAAYFIEIGQRKFTKTGLGWLFENKPPIAPIDKTKLTDRDMATLICLTPSRAQYVLHVLEKAGGVVIAAPRLMTKSGANAEIKAAEEIAYPSMTKDKMETRDVGVVLNTTPVVGPDGYTIDLTLLPQYVELTGWRKHRLTVTAEDGSIIKSVLRQPVFRSLSLATCIQLWSGQTAMMGGVSMGKEPPSFLGRLIGRQPDGKLLFLFVTARVVDPAGNPVR